MAHEASTKNWQPAIYARLSDDDGRAGVSLSIEHQLEILKGYVHEKGWQSPKIFYDDDKKGTNFNRKGFQDMYAEAQRGNINVIIIKDTSRFGRNWVKSGDYFDADVKHKLKKYEIIYKNFIKTIPSAKQAIGYIPTACFYVKASQNLQISNEFLSDYRRTPKPFRQASL
jgi:DNA invertase Pin-like site-specific DNA recombinase